MRLYQVGNSGSSVRQYQVQTGNCENCAQCNPAVLCFWQPDQDRWLDLNQLDRRPNIRLLVSQTRIALYGMNAQISCTRNNVVYLKLTDVETFDSKKHIGRIRPERRLFFVKEDCYEIYLQS
jgi:hypothetical protein